MGYENATWWEADPENLCSHPSWTNNGGIPPFSGKAIDSLN